MFPPVLNEVFLSLGLLRGTFSTNVPAWNCYFIQTNRNRNRFAITDSFAIIKKYKKEAELFLLRL